MYNNHISCDTFVVSMIIKTLESKYTIYIIPSFCYYFLIVMGSNIGLNL